GARVRRYGFFGDSYDEELAVDPQSVRTGWLDGGNAPLLDSHAARSLANVLGVVVPGTVRLDGGVGRARVRLDDGPETQPVLRKLQRGMIRNVSVGYRVHKYEVTEADGQPPLYRAVDWEPMEISFVPIPADTGAGLRADAETYPCEIVTHNPE